MGSDAVCRCVLPRAIRQPRRADASQSRIGAGSQPVRDGEGGGGADQHCAAGLAVRRAASAVRRQRALGHHQRSAAGRDLPPRFCRSRVRCHDTEIRSAQRGPVSGEASLLSRRDRAVQQPRTISSTPVRSRRPPPRSSSPARSRGSTSPISARRTRRARHRRARSGIRCSMCSACWMISERRRRPARCSPTSNRMAASTVWRALDTRLTFAKVYSLSFQGGGSSSRVVIPPPLGSPPGTPSTVSTAAGPIWEAHFIRAGRTFGLNYDILGIDPEFLAGRRLHHTDRRGERQPRSAGVVLQLPDPRSSQTLAATSFWSGSGAIATSRRASRPKTRSFTPASRRRCAAAGSCRRPSIPSTSATIPPCTPTTTSVTSPDPTRRIPPSWAPPISRIPTSFLGHDAQFSRFYAFCSCRRPR